MSTSQRKFIIGFHRTSVCSSTVYQCNTCLLRFTSKSKHLKVCKKPAVLRVQASSTDDFTDCLKDASILNLYSCAFKDSALLVEYNINREEGGNLELTRFQSIFLLSVKKGTQFLRNPVDIKDTLGRIQTEKKNA